MRNCKKLSILSLFTLVAILPLNIAAEFNPIELVTDPNPGLQSDNIPTNPGISLSDDGRFVVFDSEATNLVANDDNDQQDIFLYDKDADEGERLERISVNSDENEADGSSLNGAVSADGRYVVFESTATDLISGDANDVSDIFLRDRTEGTTTRISVTSDGNEADGASTNPRISSDGRYVIFQSAATDLVSGDSNDQIDIFLRDTDTDTTTRISLASDDSEGDGDSTLADISADGNVIVFQSDATNLVGDDDNALTDIFAVNITGDTVTRISEDTGGVDSDGASTLPRISSDGLSLVFQSDATDLISGDSNGVQDVFLYTFGDDSIVRVSEGSVSNIDGMSLNGSINSDGSYVIFQSMATDLVGGDSNDMSDIYIYDVSDETVTRVSVTDIGLELDGESITPTINSNGQFIAFVSADENLVTGDSNELSDLFLLDTQCLIEPDGVTPQDQDSDGTDDCEDNCPTDADKTEVGTCGCGVAETDTDSDGTLDCNDGCPSDADKTSPGSCGCGESEIDGNANGVPDCLDPTSETKPRKPVVIYRKKRQNLSVIIPQSYPNFSYQVQVRQGSRIIRKKNTRSIKIRVPVKGIRGRVRVRYRVALSPGFSKFSNYRKIRLR